MTCVRISDHKDNYLSFDMRDILPHLEGVGSFLEWYILDIEGQSTPGADMPIMELERDISAKNAKTFTWKQLKRLADQILQTNNCIVVGVSPGQAPPRLPLDSKYCREFVVVAAFDSSFWTVCAPQPNIIRELQSAFRETTIVDDTELNYAG